MKTKSNTNGTKSGEADRTDAPREAEAAPAGEAAGAEPGRSAATIRQREIKRLEKRLVRAVADEARRQKQLTRAQSRRAKIERSIETLRNSPLLADPIVDPAAPMIGDGHGTAAESEGEPLQAYCVRERRKVELVSPVNVVLGNRRAALAGRCPHCGATVYRIVGVAAGSASTV